MEYSFTQEEKTFIKKMNFDFEVNKNMTDEQLFFVIDKISNFIQTEGIGKNGFENRMGKMGADILTKMAHEDSEDEK